MAIKQIKVYFDQNALPYKDKELQVHFPVVGNTFQNGSLTTQIRFYIDNLEMGDSCVWIALCKLPNGQRGYTRLSVYEDSDEDYSHYALLELTNWHTQYNGDLNICLQGYDGNIELVEDDENNVLIPTGVPVIQATGSIKLTIAYATGVIEGGDVETHTLQELWAYFGEFLRNDSGKYFKVVSKISDINTTVYEDYVHNGDLVFDMQTNEIAKVSGTYPSMTWSYPTLYFHSVRVSSDFKALAGAEFFDEVRVRKGTSYLTFGDDGLTSLQDYLDEKQNQIPVVTISPTHTGTITNTALLNSLASFPSYLTYTYNGQSFIYMHCETDGAYYYFRKLFDRSVIETGSYAIYGGDVFIQVNKTTGVYSQLSAQILFYNKAQADFTFGASLGVSIDPTTYVMTMLLKDKNGDTLSTQSVDLPLESMVVGGTYDEDEQEIVLTLQSGDTITIPVADLISGLVSTTDLANALASYVAKTFTIAGIDMQDNITAQELTDSLVFATNTDIDNLFA